MQLGRVGRLHDRLTQGMPVPETSFVRRGRLHLHPLGRLLRCPHAAAGHVDATPARNLTPRVLTQKRARSHARSSQRADARPSCAGGVCVARAQRGLVGKQRSVGLFTPGLPMRRRASQRRQRDVACTQSHGVVCLQEEETLSVHSPRAHGFL